MMLSDELSIKKLKRFLKWCQQDPVTFVRKVFYVEPSEQQAKLLMAAADPKARVTVRSGVSTGKTTTDAWLIWWHVICHYHSKCAVTAPTKTQLKDALWSECALWHGRMHPFFRARTDLTGERAFVIPDAGGQVSQFATFKTASKANPEALQGLHADYVMAIVDEAAGVDDAVFDPLRGSTGTYGTRFIFTANPNRAAGYFHRTHTNAALRKRFVRLQFNSWDSPHSPKDELQGIADEYGKDSDMYRVRVLGEFPSASPLQLISTDLVLQQTGLHLRKEQYDFAPIILGVDVAWMGDDRSVVVLRQGLRMKILGVWHKIDNMTLAGMVSQYWDQYKVDACFVDAGWGSGVIDRLRQLGRHPVQVWFGGKPGKVKFHNKRSEMWWGIREWLEAGGVLEDNEDLRLDLTAPEYYPIESGQVQLERKADIKKRAGFSPDMGDALALTFAQPVTAKRDHFVGAHSGTTNAEYNLFG
jgi:hypothetical protein